MKAIQKELHDITAVLNQYITGQKKKELATSQIIHTISGKDFGKTNKHLAAFEAKYHWQNHATATWTLFKNTWNNGQGNKQVWVDSLEILQPLFENIRQIDPLDLG